MPPMPSQVNLTPEQIANFLPQINQYMQGVLGGDFLGSNPYIDQLIQQTEADAMRQFQEASRPNQVSDLNLSGAYGSALGQQALSNASRDFAQSLSGQTAGIRSQDYQSERDRMMQALQLLSGETVASRQGLFGARDTDVQSATNIKTANIGKSGQLGAARIGANASKHNARLAQQAAFWNNALNRSQQMRGFTGGQPEPIGQRQGSTGSFDPAAGFSGGKGLVGQGVWGGPAGGPVKYTGPMGDPWNNPGAF